MGSTLAMPQLLNRRHELVARALASGESASTAYRAAGYQCAPHKARGHGHRLRTREDIAARVQELIDKPQNRIATQQIVEAIRTGRPTIYRPELATLARKLALLGATDQEMADALGIDQGTLDRWKTRHKEFRIAIQHGKIRADAEIAQSLYNRAHGMSLPPSVASDPAAVISYHAAAAALAEAVAVAEENTTKILDTHMLVAARIDDLPTGVTDPQLRAQEKTLHERIARQIEGLRQVAAAW